ncbi:MAG TPA: helix-turn-helix domain-containing protein [Tepidisphaeraceae bacterium]|jgi:hypothetical protein
MEQTADMQLLWTIPETANALRICEKTLETITKRGEIKRVKIGKRVFYAVAEVQDFIRRQSVAA